VCKVMKVCAMGGPVIALTQVPGCQKLSNTIPKKSSEVALSHPEGSAMRELARPAVV
jgi:hypothetical protein